MREFGVLVPARPGGSFQPRDRLVDLALFDKVGSNVVVRIAEVRVDFDGAVTLRDGRVVVTHETVGPT